MSDDIIQNLSSEQLEARKRIVNEISQKYQLERYIYLAGSIISLIIVIALATYLFFSKQISFSQLAMFIGPTGFLAYAVTRILYMWSTSLKVIFTGKI